MARYVREMDFIMLWYCSGLWDNAVNNITVWIVKCTKEGLLIGKPLSTILLFTCFTAACRIHESDNISYWFILMNRVHLGRGIFLTWKWQQPLNICDLCDITAIKNNWRKPLKNGVIYDYTQTRPWMYKLCAIALMNTSPALCFLIGLLSTSDSYHVNLYNESTTQPRFIPLACSTQQSPGGKRQHFCSGFIL